MSFDGIVTNAVVNELNKKILGGRVDKIHQPEKDEILISIHHIGSNYKLVLSASSSNPRIYLTDHSKKNPASPPMFCMLLRKHLSGGIITNIEQYEMDRVVFIDISSTDELGNPSEIRLAMEIMGKHSNIILMDKSSLKIMDSIKRVPHDVSRVRQILPGFYYEYPPIQDKLNPLKTNFQEFKGLYDNENKNTPVFKFIYFNYLGISPLISKEICFDSGLDVDRSLLSLEADDLSLLYKSFENMVNKIKRGNFNPLYITTEDPNEILVFHCLDINQFGSKNKNHFDSISKVLDSSYKSKDTLDRIKQKSQSMKKSIHVKLERAQSKLSKQMNELLESKDREKYKIYADLISANLYRIPKGVNSIGLENYYDENLSTVDIPLDIKLSPVQNAQRYYKKYTKLKNANQLLMEQIPETEAEIQYLEHVIQGIDNSTEVIELDEIKDELIKEGYLKGNDKNKKKKVKEPQVSPPEHYISSDGTHIYVGKNNRQNDYLTMKFASKEDLWFHVQNMPGSHVIVKNQGSQISDSTLEEAASLAAYYSKGKNGSNIAVDYTIRKNVRKPKNAKTGMVIYENFQTIIISPKKEIIQKIIKVED